MMKIFAGGGQPGVRLGVSGGDREYWLAGDTEHLLLLLKYGSVKFK
ncbi:MAG: hypothetical protein MUO40_11580 [Anaerolineaceae bacterium]|nr:hypothetical protein [Anaerolineaceae bacterium]